MVIELKERERKKTRSKFSCLFLSGDEMSGIIIKHGTRLISRVRSISKWPPHWIYYDLNANISHEQPHFTHIRIYQVFLSLAHTAWTVSTCSSIADVRDRSTSKTGFSSSSFYVSFLSKTLLRGNLMLRKAARASLERKHCA